MMTRNPKEQKMTKRTRWIVLAAFALVLLAPIGLAYTAPGTQPDSPVIVPGNGVVPTTATPATTKPAESGVKDSTTKPDPKSQDGGGIFGNNLFLYGMIALIILMFWWSSRGKKKQEQQRRDMLSNLKKGDKVTTTSGIIGTLIEVRDDEVILKVDETNNIRMRFLRGAIMNVGDRAKTEEQKK
jgi:preprotein translocase subunit YajC